MSTYEKGDDNAEEVQRIQEALGIEADGEFGSDMMGAVRRWQKSNGQKADGMVGPDMLIALGLDDLVIVEKGDEGDTVKALQQALGVNVDGEFGGQTETALKAWQKSNGQKANGKALLPALKQIGALGDARPKPAPHRPQSQPAAPPAPSSSGSIPARANIASWAYQLAAVDPDTIASLPVDLCVIDYSVDGDDSTAFKPADTAKMKTRPDGGRKLLISYMSIGEAEDYRYYWQKSWETKKTRPAWLDDLNPAWEGNYKVRYWDPAWQQVIMGTPYSYLDKIIAAGFDGVYLDIIDAFEYWTYDKPERKSAPEDMIAFVTEIANYGRARRPGFWVIPQNGEALLEYPEYRKVISAIGKEDIFYGQDGDGKANKKDVVDDCVGNLKYARDAGIPILAIEYLKDGRKITDAQSRLASIGCTATFGPRDLKTVDLAQFGGSQRATAVGSNAAPSDQGLLGWIVSKIKG